MKLGVIATGVGASTVILGKLLSIATTSSAHMAATQKIWETSIRMIFRPMGDTIGLILRPFALMMLRWALPFYRDFTQNIGEVQAGGEAIARGEIPSGVGQIGGGILDTIFGEGAGEAFRTNAKAWQDIFNGIIEGFAGFSNWEVLPQVMADTGEEVDNVKTSIVGLKDELGLFEQIVKKVQEVIEVGNLTPLGLDFGEGSGIEATGREGRGNKSNVMSRSDFLAMRKSVGNRATLQYLRDQGMSVGSRDGGFSGGTNPRAGSQGITVNLNNPRLDDPDLGRKIQEQIQMELKKLPGRHSY